MDCRLRPMMAALGALLLLAVHGFVHAQLSQAPFPVKPLRFMVGYAPGGGTDIMARIIANRLPDVIKQPVVVENRPGANGNLAAEMVARQPADGYTVMFISASHAMNKSVYRNLAYDIERDFVPLAILSEVPNVLAVHPSLPVTTVKDLIRIARARPGQITYGVAGLGSPGHFAGAMLSMLADIELLVVPYKGGGPLAGDLMAGHVVATFNALPALISHIRSGRMRAVAVSTEQRVSTLPDVPAIAETLPGYSVSTWYGSVVRTGTAEEIAHQLSLATLKVLAMAEVTQALAEQGAVAVGSGPTQSAAFIRAEVAKYAKLAKAASIRLD